MADKSERAFRTISEAAETVGVPQHVLRFWETRFSQLQPLKRGGNRRYYRPVDMDLLETIRAMLHDEGLTIRGAQLALATRVAGPVITKDAAAPPIMEPRIMKAESVPAPGLDVNVLRRIRNQLALALAA
ncbi:MerR family transcriptional regulator [Sandarakinorhabdus sp.]|uniref:MerR family transcriptional regulator n=1 Tax=Sandarakinorhabdus sp. TaxID=1916663 RepID=UPI00286E58C3|nr:MerR family transcriptional regulator [Sandarakinorhabdus sp.]